MSSALSVKSGILRAVWLAGVALMLVVSARAADVSVRASLSRGVTVIGEPVQYEIKISGARRRSDPPEVQVEGLEIRYLGPAENSVVRFSNGVFTSERTVRYVFEVNPEKNGTFTIPAVAIEADGKTYRTEPVGLTVQQSPANDQQATGFAEIVIPKKTAYVGETIPVEVRLYVDTRVRWRPIAMAEIAGEGFTKQKMPEPQREQADKNGREYDLLIFKTAITPSRAGKITIGPSEIPYEARIPRARKGGPRSLFDNLFDDDVFGDPMFSALQQLKAKAPAVEITVKPLPAEGKPRDFSGAVGTFQFAAEGNPKTVKLGDPVTMKLRVSGRGNFDRLVAPALQDASGWRTYPPSSAFTASDDIGYSGTKTFEMAVVPETKKAAMPMFQFSYFDPLAEKYVTLNSEPAPLTVEGGAPPPPPPPKIAGGSKAPAKAAPTPAPPARPNDILGPRYDEDSSRSYAPLYTRRGFWYAQGGAGLSLLLFLGLRLRHRPDAAEREETALRREKATALARLRGTDLGHVEFLQTAARVAQIEMALATGQNAASIDAATVRCSGALSEESKAVFDDIFSTRAELLYAGGSRDEGQVSPKERERVLGALRELEKGYERS